MGLHECSSTVCDIDWQPVRWPSWSPIQVSRRAIVGTPFWALGSLETDDLAPAPMNLSDSREVQGLALAAGPRSPKRVANVTRFAIGSPLAARRSAKLLA